LEEHDPRESVATFFRVFEPELVFLFYVGGRDIAQRSVFQPIGY
jgi:hypothetical protein